MRARTPVPGRGGFTLVEACLAISLLGIMLAMAAPTFVEALRTSKTAEAGELLARMVAGANAYYAGFHEPQSMGASGPTRQLRCLPPAAGPVPEVPGSEAQAVAFGADSTPGAPTWVALGFEPPHPVHYAYEFSPSESGCALNRLEQGPVTVRFVAHGDLDGDGELSVFGRVGKATGEGLELEPLLMVDRRTE